jgi:hypothetical protein
MYATKPDSRPAYLTEAEIFTRIRQLDTQYGLLRYAGDWLMMKMAHGVIAWVDCDQFRSPVTCM